MKIIFTVNTYYPLKDGVQFVTQYLAEGLAKKGHNVIVITSSITCDNAPEHEFYNGVEIYRVKAAVKHTFNIGEKKEVKKLIMTLTENSDALVNVCTQTALTDWTFPLLKHIKCKKILYIHGIMDLKLRLADFSSVKDIAHRLWNVIRYKIYYRHNKKYIKNYDEITQLHQYDSGNLFFEKKYKLNSNIMENAAANEFFEVYEKNISDLPAEYMLCVANYIDRKNQKMILEAFYMSKLPENIELILIGSEKTSYYYELEKLITMYNNKYGMKKVQLLTNVPREYVSEYTKNASLYLLGSKWEAFPISIIESMAAGVPFVSTNVGIVKYLPGGVVVKSVDEMTYWIELFMSNRQMSSKLGMVGKEYAIENLCVEKKVNQFEKLLEK